MNNVAKNAEPENLATVIGKLNRIINRLELIESSGGPTVTRKQCNAWSDRMTSEMEVVGYVPAWLIVEMLREAGVKVES